jgi:hypothetical protein
MVMNHKGHHTHKVKQDPKPENKKDAAAPANNKKDAAAPANNKKDAAAPANNKKNEAAPSNNKKANNNKETATNVVGSVQSKDVVVDTPPYKITRCDQVVMFNAQTLSDDEDYLSRKDVFFTMSAYLINMFETKDNNKLLESVGIAHITKIPDVLEGTKTCLIFLDSVSIRNIVMCFNSEDVMNQIHEAFKEIMQCRVGGKIDDFDPSIINEILNVGCKGITSPEGAEYDFASIRAQLIQDLSSKEGVKLIFNILDNCYTRSNEE